LDFPSNQTLAGEALASGNQPKERFMKKKLGKKMLLTRETLESLDVSPLKDLVGAASLACSTATRPACSGCETCAI
jgi:hypothetical protein